jgi:exopolyphosphatase/guanosine-5'-triphosphate,3'-diphosphate pyrophosphatase
MPPEALLQPVLLPISPTMNDNAEIEINEQPFSDGRIGIIDIGSNSIRMVVYDQQKRSPVPIYNEKVMCALGKGLASSGVLNPEGVELGKQALKRFNALGRNMEISSLYVMATAAVRDAKDGAAFARYLEDTYSISVDIISGKKEAKLGAYGVSASIYKPNGITGDLGGGSLEMVKVDNGDIKDHASLLLGSLRMIDESKGDRDKLRKLIEKRFNELDWLDDKKVANFYAIGGTFRALAKMHMTINNYPLHILHEYKIDAKNFLSFVREIASFSFEKLEKLPGSAAKRIPALPGAAIVLDHIITRARPDDVVISASGIREGYLFEKLTPFVRGHDGLIASCSEFATKGGRSISYANELYTWMFPLVADENDKERRLRLAFCLLSDIAQHIHPEYRAEWSYNRIMCSALTSITHRERIKLALALYHRYQFRRKEELPAQSLLKASDQEWARLVGSAANLGFHLSGSIQGNLHKTSFLIEKNTVSLQLTGSMQDLYGDAVKRRVEGVRLAYEDYLKR